MNESKVKRDPEGTRRRILDAATQQFSTHGLAGARVDAIAAAAGTNERMLYYYFESKEGLYVAVLEAMYVDFANHEVGLDLSGLQPTDAIRALARSIWDYLRANAQWLNLINNENLHGGQYLERSAKLREAISPVISLLSATLAGGASAGEFRADVDALDFYVTLVAMGYYVVSNRFTLKAFVGRDYSEPSALEAVSAMQVEMLLSFLRPASAATSLCSASAGAAAREDGVRMN
ncbi:TetR family transcriptional regulator [Paraburkholderia hospita]|uniref:TetR family transcriptional regulator n=1 Tax=Paraburkholderia hospita TaxID=169430 RepID=A0ABP2PU71_9BURK|nr:TetR/AcrR family transcriptional regulator [Paraburkholderia hospita]EIN01325.1 TetR family transcriptional regulator [Paraburkholderia hospita]OUL87552.1 TetR family transcriptional regulator [Paraburkholderia hospita]